MKKYISNIKNSIVYVVSATAIRLIFTIIWVVFMFIYCLVNQKISNYIGEIRNTYQNASSVINIITILFAAYLYSIVVRGKKNNGLASYCNFNDISVPKLLLCAIGGSTLNVLIVAVLDLLCYAKVGLFLNYQNSYSTTHNNISLILYIISFSIVTPIFEEILFRGIIQNELNDLGIISMVIQPIFFAIYHLNLVQGLYSFIFGMVLTVTLFTFKSIWPCIIMHIFFNFTNVIFNDFINKNIFSNYIYEIIFISFISFCTFLSFVIIKFFKRKVYLELK